MGLAIAGFMGVLYMIESTVLLNSFRQVEQQAARQDMQRTLDALTKELDGLSVTTRDYASWDDTYNYVQQPDPGSNDPFIQSNFSSSTFISLQLGLVAVIDVNHHVVFSFGFDAEDEEKTPLPAAMLAHLQPDSPLLQHQDVASIDTGIVLLPEGLLQVASQPILTSNGDGPSRGSLIMGRYLNADNVAELAALTQTSLTIQPLTQANLPPDFQNARQQLLADYDSGQQAGSEIVVQPLSSDRIASYTLLADLIGKPVLLLRVDAPRDIYQQGQLSLHYLRLSLIGLGLIFTLITSGLWHQLMRYLAERDRMEQALSQERDQAQTTLRSIGDGVITTDDQGRIQSLNLVAEKMTGWCSADAVGQPLTAVLRVVDEDTREPATDLVNRLLQRGHQSPVDNRYRLLLSADGQEFAIDESVALIRDSQGHIRGSVVVFRDVTQARKMARQLSWQASYDALTGLVNRREFDLRLASAITLAQEKQAEHSLCFLDLDRFKLVNDTCGHVAGDELLRQVSTMLRSSIRKTDTVARLGGDEFCVLLYQCSLAEATSFAQTLCDKMQEFRFIWQDQVFLVGLSVGVVNITVDSPSAEIVLSNADAACYMAKYRGRNRVCVYQANDHELNQQRSDLQWVNRINQALEDDRFCLYSQTIEPLHASHINDGQSDHYEVLLRMLDEDGRLVSPGMFIPVAERYSLMPAIDRWVIQALFSSQQEHYRRAWERQLTRGETCLYSINLSGASINDNQFVEFLQEQFERYRIPPQVICFEITETVAIANLSRAAHFMRQLKLLGCRFALDDFGSGMSSFAYLKSLPVDYLKIDGHFIKDIEDDPIALAMVEAIHRVGRVMGLQTIAEFVSSAGIYQQVADLGIDYAQGYKIARPRLLWHADQTIEDGQLQWAS